MKLAVVVQRYGLAINGGAELHARYVAERLARHAQVEVITTCASDYVTWKNELPAGTERVNDLTVRRFRVSHQRDPFVFGRRSDRIFGERHSVADELKWLDAEGPSSRALVRYVSKHAVDYDYWIFFSYRYYHAYHGARAAASRAILVPTAERDPALGVSIFRPIFKGVRAIMYNSHEERSTIQALSENHDVPSVVVGVGSEVPQNPQPRRFREKFGIRDPFAVYVGRIDENKGCPELFDFFESYRSTAGGRLSLVLVGHSLLPIPDRPYIRHLGFLEDTDKFDAIAAAEVLIMPSFFESLSMVTLEAWALGRPVLVNSRCDVLKGQCLRSNAGLYYDGMSEFVETLLALEQNRWLAASLGRNGQRFFRSHYEWPVIERKYLDMLERLGSEPATQVMEPLPGWLARRQPRCAPASDILAGIPSGPVRTTNRASTTPPGLGVSSRSTARPPSVGSARSDRRRPQRGPRRTQRPGVRRRTGR